MFLPKELGDRESRLTDPARAVLSSRKWTIVVSHLLLTKMCVGGFKPAF
jgi:hypothetical protein